VLFGATMLEELEYAAGDSCDYGDDDPGVLQRQEPGCDSGRGRGDEHDIEPSAQPVRGFDDMKVMVAEAELDFEQHGETYS